LSRLSSARRVCKCRPARTYPAEHYDQLREANPDHEPARSKARQRGTERCAQHRAAASNLEQPGSAARSEALPRDSERQEALLSQASHALSFSSKSEDQQ
jgi:hypothetical protein